jgi:hypothetical protein
LAAYDIGGPQLLTRTSADSCSSFGWRFTSARTASRSSRQIASVSLHAIASRFQLGAW